MKRRDFLVLLAGSAAVLSGHWSFAAHAQHGDRVRRIAVLMTNAEGDPEGRSRAAAFRRGLQELGWTEGQNLRIDWRWSGGDLDRMRHYAAEVTALTPDLIVANGAPNLSAIRRATLSIPIVFVLVSDPIGQGFVASLAQPGGNITGFSFVEYSMFGKSLDLLMQIAAGVTRVGFIFNPDTVPFYDRFLPAFETHARHLSVEVTAARVRTETEIDAAIASLAAAPGGGLIVPPDTYTVVHRGRIERAAAQRRVPAIYSYRQVVREGGLISYGPEVADIFQRSASYVDRILKGAKPADLPVQAPTKFELAINLKTAAALGLDVPSTLPALADEVIE
jgi:putative tryptophan/tyrosine transport system substrate-binding protein